MVWCARDAHTFGAQVRRALLELSGADGGFEVFRRADDQVSGGVLRARPRAARAVLAHPARVDLSPTHHMPRAHCAGDTCCCRASRTRSTEASEHSEEVYHHERARPGAARPSSTCCAAAAAVPRGAWGHAGGAGGPRVARGGAGRAVAGRAGAGAGGAVAPSAGAVLGMREGARGAPQVERYGPGQTACRTRCFVIYAMFRPLCMCVCVDLE